MIVVTTPTGAIGRQVLANLIASDEPIRVIVRDPARLPANIGERVEVVEGTHDDPVVLDRAFRGADSVLWVVPPNPLANDVDATYLDFTRPACEALQTHGVERVVGVSALGRGTAMAGHAGLVTASLAMDDLIASTGVDYRALTMPSFMENVLRQAEPIKSKGLFFSPLSADRKHPICATRDIARVGANLLLDCSWSGQGSVAVLGPENLSPNDMAATMSHVLGRPIGFQQIPFEEFKAGLTRNGISEAFAQGMVDMMIAKDNGLDDAEPRTPATTAPTSFRQWCEEVLKPIILS